MNKQRIVVADLARKKYTLSRIRIKQKEARDGSMARRLPISNTTAGKIEAGIVPQLQKWSLPEETASQEPADEGNAFWIALRGGGG